MNTSIKLQQSLMHGGRALKGFQPACLFSSTTSIHKEFDYLEESIIPTFHFQKSLPRLPIPKLEESTARYLNAQKPLLTTEQYDKTKLITKKFLKYDGKDLHAKLVEKDELMKHTSYISEPWFDMYLSYRESLVLNHNVYLVAIDDPNTNDPLTRATKLIYTTLRFKKSLDAGKLEPDVYHLNPKKSDTSTFRRLASLTPSSLSRYVSNLFNAYPLDMSQYKNMFNSTRVPKTDKDELKMVEGARQILVIRNGNIFLFDALKEDGSLVCKEDIHANLSAIMKASNDKVVHPLALLTSERRDTWASLRKHLETNPKNAELLHKLDSALFGVFLDDRDCNNEHAAMEMFLYGEGHSIWFDKSFNFGFSKDGKFAFNLEHSWGDGVGFLRFVNDIIINSNEDSYTPNATISNLLTVQKLDFELDNTVTEAIDKARKTFIEHTSDRVNLSKMVVKEFGKNFFKTKKVSPDAMMQLAFQIAYYRQHGKYCPTYESCSTATYKHGRTETIRSCTTATADCVEAFELSHSANVEEMEALLRKTSAIHVQLSTEAAMGQGFDRHLFALRYLAKKSSKEVEFFNDDAYKNINHITLSTTTVGATFTQMGGFAPVTPTGFGVTYTAFDDSLDCNISSYKESSNGNEFATLIYESLQDIYSVLNGESFKN